MTTNLQPASQLETCAGRAGRGSGEVVEDLGMLARACKVLCGSLNDASHA